MLVIVFKFRGLTAGPMESVGFRNFEQRISVYWYKVFMFSCCLHLRGSFEPECASLQLWWCWNIWGVSNGRGAGAGERKNFFSPGGSIWACSGCMYMLVFCTFFGHVCQPSSVYTFIVQILRQYTALQKNPFPLGDVNNLLEGHSMVTQVHRLIADEVCF